MMRHAGSDPLRTGQRAHLGHAQGAGEGSSSWLGSSKWGNRGHPCSLGPALPHTCPDRPRDRRHLPRPFSNQNQKRLIVICTGYTGVCVIAVPQHLSSVKTHSCSIAQTHQLPMSPCSQAGPVPNTALFKVHDNGSEEGQALAFRS